MLSSPRDTFTVGGRFSGKSKDKDGTPTSFLNLSRTRSRSKSTPRILPQQPSTPPVPSLPASPILPTLSSRMNGGNPPSGVRRQGWGEVKTNSRIAPWYVHQWIVLSEDAIQIYKEQPSTLLSKKAVRPVHVVRDTEINSVELGQNSTLSFAFRALAHVHAHTIELHAAWSASDPHSRHGGVHSLPSTMHRSGPPPVRRFVIAFKTREERDFWLHDIRLMVEPVVDLKSGRFGERQAIEAKFSSVGGRDGNRRGLMPDVPPIPPLPSIITNSGSDERMTIDLHHTTHSPSPATPVSPFTPVTPPDDASQPQKNEEEDETDAAPSELRNSHSKTTMTTNTTSMSASASRTRLPPSSYRPAHTQLISSSTAAGPSTAQPARQRTWTVSSFASIANSSTTSLDEISPSVRTRGSMLSMASVRRSRLGKVGEWLGVTRGDDGEFDDDDDEMSEVLRVKGRQGHVGLDGAFGGLGMLPNVSTGQLSLDFERFQPAETLLHHSDPSRQRRRNSRLLNGKDVRPPEGSSTDGDRRTLRQSDVGDQPPDANDSDPDEDNEPLDLTGSVSKLGSTPIGSGVGGGFGEVWKGKWLTDGTSRAVVIKIIHPSLLFSASLASPSSPSGTFRSTDGPPSSAGSRHLQSQSTPALRALLQAWHTTPRDTFIVPLWGVMARPTLSIVTPFMKNGNARDWLDKMDLTHTSGGWQVGRVRRLKTLLQVAQGLEYLHRLSPPVVHGNLKGSNVLINEAGEAYLTDFGLAPALCDAAGVTASGVSSARWLAYELAAAASPPTLEPSRPASMRPSSSRSAPSERNRKQSSEDYIRRPSVSRSHREFSKRNRVSEEDPSDLHKDECGYDPSESPTSSTLGTNFTRESDIWSFGSTMYELLSGRLPYFHRTSDVQVLHEIALGLLPRRSNSTIPQDLWEWLEKRCWVPDPSRRADVAEVVFMLDKFAILASSVDE